ncbi:MAG: hypothetical protein QMD11_12465 [Smithella sp.]|nr:hypothetical protein [Smithella sp.]
MRLAASSSCGTDKKTQEAVCLKNAPLKGAFFLSNILIKEGEYN